MSKKGNSRKIASILLSIAMVMTSIPVYASSEEPVTEITTEAVTEQVKATEAETQAQATEAETPAQAETPAHAPEEPKVEEPAPAPASVEQNTQQEVPQTEEKKDEKSEEQTTEAKEEEMKSADADASKELAADDDDDEEEEEEDENEGIIILAIDGETAGEFNIADNSSTIVNALADSIHVSDENKAKMKADLVTEEVERNPIDLNEDDNTDLAGTVASQEDETSTIILYTNTEELGRFTLVFVEDDEYFGVLNATTINDPTLFEITFDANGGELSDDETVLYRAEGEAISYIPVTASKANSNFVTWTKVQDDLDEAVDDNYIVDDDMTLYAFYQEAEEIQITLDWNYIPDGETESHKEERDYLVPIDATQSIMTPLPEAERDGYTFKGWALDPDATVGYKSANLDQSYDGDTFYAVWKAGVMPTITYDYDKDDYIETVNYNIVGYYEPDNSGIAEPIIVDFDDSEFLGWFDDADNEVEVDTTVDSDTYLKAKWSDPTLLTFDPGTNGQVIGLEDLVKEDVVEEDIIDEEYNTESQCVIFTRKSLSTYLTGLPEAEAFGKTFLGWYTKKTGGTEVKLTTSFTEENPTVYAHWETVPLEVTFDANGGEFTDPDAATRTINKGDAVGELPEVTYTDKEFLGWFTEAEDGNKITEETIPEDEVTYYAHWKNVQKTVTYDPTGGRISGDLTSTVDIGTTVENLPSAVYDGFDFAGWFTEEEGGDEFTTETPVTEDITVYAHWVNQSKTVTFNPNGGTTTETSREVVQYTTVGQLPEATRDNFDFAGWYTEAEGGDMISQTTIIMDDITFYAHWTEKKPELTSLTVTNKNVAVNFGDPLDAIDFIYTPTEAADRAEFYWTSSDPTILYVEGTQNIRYGSNGGTVTMTIHSVDDSKSDTCTVVVTKQKILVQRIFWDEPEQTIYLGDSINMVNDYEPHGAENAEFVYTTSNPNIIDIGVDDNGDLWHSFGGQYGTVTLTKSTVDGTVSGSTVITVNERPQPQSDPQEIKYTVTFRETGDSTINPIEVDDGESVTLPSASREGYTWDGWFYANGEAAGTSITPTSDVTLYGHWTKIEDTSTTFTVIFDAQNGETPESKEYNEGETFGTLPSPTKEGCTLNGWYTSATGGTKISSTDTVNSNKTVYAQWTENETDKHYALKVNPNGGYINKDGSVKEITGGVVVGTTTNNNIADYTPSKENFTFTGWYDAKTGGTMIFSTDGNYVGGNDYWNTEGKYVGSSDLIVYAQWQQNPETRDLTYAVRGGTEIPTETYELGTMVSLHDKVTTRDGYTFLGWFDSATGGNLLEAVEMTKDTTVYAHWEKNDPEPPAPQECTLTFDSQGGTTYDSITDLSGTSIELPTPEREGFTFNGWFTEPTGGTKLTSVTLSKDMTIYAQWTEIPPEPTTYTVTFDPQYEEATVVEVRENTTLRNFPTPTREGFTFLGWFTEPEGGEKVTFYKAVANKTFYAHWEENVEPVVVEHTLTFDPNGGNPLPEDKATMTVVHGTRVESSQFPTPERDGYTFKGYYTTATGTSKVNAVTVKSDLTIYAHWKEIVVTPETYTVVLNAENGSENQTFTMKTNETFSAFTTPTKAGYDFMGWYTEKIGGTAVTSYVGNPGSTITFYAHWQIDTEEEGDKVTHLQLNYHTLTVKANTKLGLKYTYGPAGASNAQFVYKTSDPNIVKTDGTKLDPTGKAGDVVITISTVDGSLSDSCRVKVVEAPKSESRGTFKGVSGSGNSGGSTSGGSGTSGNGQNGNGTGTGTGASGSTSGGNGASNAGSELGRYSLTLIMKDGTRKNVAINSDVALNSLASKLGYEVGKYELKTADGNKVDLDGSVQMKELNNKTNSGEILIIAYDKDGKPMGSAKVKKVANGEFTVTLSEDIDAELDATPFVDTSTEGKGTDVNTKVQTGDTDTIVFYGFLGLMMAAALMFLESKKRKAAK